MIQIDDEEKLQILVDNKAKLNYRELTNFLELPYLRGNAKEHQLSELSRVCNIKKDKTKYEITEIYNSKLVRLSQKNGKSTTLPDIEYILLSQLSKSGIDGTLFVSNKELLRLCYMINNNYYAILNDKHRNSAFIGEKYGFDDSFIEYVDKAYDILKPSLINALRSMSNRKEIAVTTGYKAVKNNGTFICASITDELGEELFHIQGKAMEKLGVKKYSDFWGRYINKRQDYYDLCNAIVKDKSENDIKWIQNSWNFDKFYQCYAITLNVSKMKFDLKSLENVKEDLNNITKDKIHNTKLLRDLSYNDIDKWFVVCNTNQGDKQYSIVEDIKMSCANEKKGE